MKKLKHTFALLFVELISFIITMSWLSSLGFGSPSLYINIVLAGTIILILRDGIKNELTKPLMITNYLITIPFVVLFIKNLMDVIGNT